MFSRNCLQIGSNEKVINRDYRKHMGVKTYVTIGRKRAPQNYTKYVCNDEVPYVSFLRVHTIVKLIKARSDESYGLLNRGNQMMQSKSPQFNKGCQPASIVQLQKAGDLGLGKDTQTQACQKRVLTILTKHFYDYLQFVWTNYGILP